jgi:A nuclease of the HNH/ENDO VII superfamily with conserved WHH
MTYKNEKMIQESTRNIRNQRNYQHKNVDNTNELGGDRERIVYDRRVDMTRVPSTVAATKSDNKNQKEERKSTHKLKSRKNKAGTIQRMERMEYDSDEYDAAMNDETGFSSSNEDEDEEWVEEGKAGDDEWYETHERSHFDFSRPKGKLCCSIGGNKYVFQNEKDGTLDFEKPADKTGNKCPKKFDVNIIGQVPFNTAKDLPTPKGDNSAHFKAANQLTGQGNKTTSPDGWTWHHHKEKGRMQLLKRKVHATFKHVGGKSIWGTI